MIPQVGTPASCIFTINAIRKHKLADLTAIEILAKLPMNVKVPSEELVMQMEGLVKFGDSISVEVRKASTLCFASLVYTTFKYAPNPEDNIIVKTYVRLLVSYLKGSYASSVLILRYFL